MKYLTSLFENLKPYTYIPKQFAYELYIDEGGHTYKMIHIKENKTSITLYGSNCEPIEMQKLITINKNNNYAFVIIENFYTITVIMYESRGTNRVRKYMLGFLKDQEKQFLWFISNFINNEVFLKIKDTLLRKKINKSLKHMKLLNLTILNRDVQDKISEYY